MDNRDLAERIYTDLNKKGADLGNVSIVFIEKTLDENGVKNSSVSSDSIVNNVVEQSEQLVCPHQATRTPNEEETGKCRQCGRSIKAN